MTFTTAIAIFTTMLVLSAIPGPSDFALVARSASAGFRQAMVMTLGIITGDAILLGAAVLGVGAAMAALADNSFWFGYLSAAILAWFGIGLLRASNEATEQQAPQAPSASSFLAGLLITLGEPEALLFYIGLLPAFVDLESISAGEVALILLLAALAIGCVKTTYAWLANRGAALLGNRYRRQLSILAGMILIVAAAVVCVRAVREHLAA